MKLRIIGWTKHEANQREFVDCGHTEQEYAEMEELVVRTLRKNDFRFGGVYHQNGDFGCPVFDDHSTMCFSMRQWGELMSRAFGGEYTEYAWENEMGKVPSKKAAAAMLTPDEIETCRKNAELALADINKKLAETKRKVRRTSIRWCQGVVDKTMRANGIELDSKGCRIVAELLYKTYEGAREFRTLRDILGEQKKTRLRRIR